jgi:hypothetical protein
MQRFSVFVSALLLAGCTGTHRTGTSRYDSYDGIKVDQMVGNNVSGAVFQRTIVCLDARRETRQVTSITNVQVAAITNQTVNSATNQTISLSTNYLVTTMTNLAPQQAGVAMPSTPEGTPATTETNALVIATNAPPSLTTNVSLSLANNQSATTSPSQAAANNQLVRTYNNQITTTSNNLTVSVMTNLVVTGETNQVVTYVTNSALIFVTNVSVIPTNLTVHDYYLMTELTPPSDFTPAQGENLILLVDGTRYAFAPTQPMAGFSTRRGYTTTFYRVSPEVLVAIANADEVRIRLRGTTTYIDRRLSSSSREDFKKFLWKYFQSEPQIDLMPAPTTVDAAITPAAPTSSASAAP